MKTTAPLALRIGDVLHVVLAPNVALEVRPRADGLGWESVYVWRGRTIGRVEMGVG